MYKLKLKTGEKIIVNDLRRSGLQKTFIGGNEYQQNILKQFHDAGFKFIIKIKGKNNKENN